MVDPPVHKFGTLVLGGGGAKGLGILGSLAYFHSLDLLGPKRISGTSIGSVIAVLIGLRISPEEIFRVASTMEAPLRGGKNLANFPRRFGVWSLTKSLAPFYAYLLAEFGESPTFAEYFERTGVHLKITASSVDRLQCVYFDHLVYPNVKVFDAVRASCCLPGIFKSVKINGEYYVDGGFVKNFPLDAWGPEVPNEDILAIAVSGFPPLERVKTVWQYFSRLAALFIMSHVRSAVNSRPGSTIIEIVLSDIPLIPTFVPKSKKKEAYLKGWAEAETRHSKKVFTLEEAL